MKLAIKKFIFGLFKLTFLARIFFAVIVAVFLYKIEIPSIEYFLYDLRTVLRPSPKPSGNIELISIDKDTLEQFNTTPDLSHHQSLIKKLSESNPAFIFYTIDITKIPADVPKDKFAAFVSSLARFYQAVNGLERKNDESSKLTLAAPFQNVQVASLPKTADTKLFAKDGITRRLFISYQEQPTFHVIAASKFNSDLNDLANIRGIFDLYDSKQVMVDFMKPGSFPVTKFEDILDGRVDLKRFENKIVLVGDDLGITHDDYIYSPYLRNIDSTTISEMHANMLETLIRNSAPIKAPDWLNLMFTILISVLTVHVVLTLKPLKGILILMGTAAAFTTLSYFAFWPFGIWLDMAHPFLAIFLCYYFFIPYRLIMENRKSWEYQQKHKLLSEVEQLKTNFIGMMSHDLKTPLARIQGMTEMISSDTTPLSSPQREGLDTIKQSAEDLLKFISTILNYAKIESEGLELHLQSKDINQIVKDVVRKHEFLAKLKHIQLITELEPLFSIQIDPELIKQVFSNLVENAIKYSPDHSKVLITSEEIEGKIIVQIADQGIGIPADEISNIFMKFFRSKYAKTSPIKGSGLGLYLAKYFVELHQGSISAESSPGQGSTFTVELPIRA
ncbi:MAG: ATP-binding protein [Pseudobdellovibrionaceae bacterium]